MIPYPSIERVKQISEKFGFQCSDADLNIYQEYAARAVNVYNESAKLHFPSTEVLIPRNRGYRPNSAQNPYNAWYWICQIKTQNEGILANKKIGIKDNIAVAGIPMMNGSRILEGFIPTYDATVVSRILNSGGEICGKTTCEDLCLSVTSYCTTYGPVRNPLNTSKVSGGSSSGNAAALVCGDIEMAVGGDQGGSIRRPAAYCGIVGMKPTFGLVPYTGCAGILTCVDHVGPMARTVKDCALLLETIAGFDDYKDCRQPELSFPVPQFSKEILKPTNKLRVGIVQEGFSICDPDVVRCIQNAIKLIQNSNKFALVEEVSVPMHNESNKIFGMVFLPGLYKEQMEGGGYGTGVSGILHEQFSEKMHQGMKTRAFALHPNAKDCMLTGAYLYDQGLGHQMYAKGSTLAYCLRKEYDKALEKYDVLMLPTMPKTAPNIPNEDNLSDYLKFAQDVIDNVKSFNLTHHPALSLNAGYSDVTDMPVGLQIVGKRWRDDIVLQTAATVECILKHLQREF